MTTGKKAPKQSKHSLKPLFIPSLANSGPAALLIGVALLQIFLAHTQQLTPSKGGGFGLFSTVDRMSNRRLVIYAVGEDWQIPIKIPASSKNRKAVNKTVSIPAKWNLKALANILKEDIEAWKLKLDSDPQQAGQVGYGKPIVALRVEVWKQQFDSESREVQLVKVREIDLKKGILGTYETS